MPLKKHFFIFFWWLPLKTLLWIHFFLLNQALFWFLYLSKLFLFDQALPFNQTLPFNRVVRIMCRPYLCYENNAKSSACCPWTIQMSAMTTIFNHLLISLITASFKGVFFCGGRAYIWSRFAVRYHPPSRWYGPKTCVLQHCGTKTRYLQCLLHGGWLARSSNMQIRRISATNLRKTFICRIYATLLERKHLQCYHIIQNLL